MDSKMLTAFALPNHSLFGRSVRLELCRCCCRRELVPRGWTRGTFFGSNLAAGLSSGYGGPNRRRGGETRRRPIQSSVAGAGVGQPLPGDVELSTAGPAVEPRRDVLNPVLEPSTDSLSWEIIDEGDCSILRPPAGVPARCIAHFVGGIFVGVVPQLLYRRLLELLAEEGIVIVATSYDITFDHFLATESVIARFELGMKRLGPWYDGLPIVGIGHSAGSLLHMLLGSLFAERAERVANVLISFNNRAARDAVPLFEELVAPAATVLLGGSPAGEAGRGGPRAAVAAIAALGAAASATPRALMYALLERVLSELERAGVVPRNVARDLPRSARESTRLVTQLEPMLREIVDGGVREFNPPPEDVGLAAQRGYDVLRTLLVKFDVDSLDDTSRAYDLLFRRSEVTLVELVGSHLTPLKQDPMAHYFVGGSKPWLREAREGAFADLFELKRIVVEYLNSFLGGGNAQAAPRDWDMIA